MKKTLTLLLFSAVFFVLPIISIAGDSYDSATGFVRMPIVTVGSDNFEVNMRHQGDLVFKVTSAVPTSITSASADTYDLSTGILHMPFVGVGADNFVVDMIHQGDLVFKITSAKPVQFTIINTEFPFIGRDVWNVFNDEETIEIDQMKYEENGNIDFGEAQGSYIIENNYLKISANFDGDEMTFYLKLADGEVWSEEKCTKVLVGETSSNINAAEYFCPTQTLANEMKANFPK